MAPDGHHDDDAPTPASASRSPPAKVPSEKELARKIRKRELDRRAQRQARERTRNRIAELEALVKELRKDDSTRLSACMEQLAAVTCERDRLLDAFKSIDQTIRNHVPSRPSPQGTGTRTTAAAAAAKLPSPAPPPRSLPDPRDVIRDPMLTGLPAHSYVAPIGLLPQTPSSSSVFDAHAYHGSGQGLVGSVPNGLSATRLHASSVDAPSSTSDSQDFVEEPDDNDDNNDNNDNDDGDGDEAHDDPRVIVPPPATPCDCGTARTPSGSSPPKVNVWRAVNQVLAKRCRISRRAHAAEDADDEDVPVRAILEGWEAAAESRPLSRLWKKLRRVDELCFQVCPPTERLAILRMMHLLLQYHSDPTPDRHAKLPTWFLKRPSQAIPHSYAIDFFVWPGVRERFVFGQHHYCNNQFWDLFSPNLHLLWPFEFRDAYKKSVVTGQYQISPMFEQRIADINAWTMGGDFFARFPELVADIPSFQSVLRSLSSPPPPPPLASPMPQQASLSRLKERGERLLLLEQQAAAEEDQSTQEGMDCTHAMQAFPPGLYSMAPPGFMDEFIPQSFDANGVGSYEPMSGYF
ncbi:bzip transcription factor [Colletotrichum tabaci]|uniref:Bzip transcription factor n=1 Tax=Colletotrichum tabaci TaxID=1209068 RepID=A0AAV9T7P2_9PEZI